jgi:hypothetical protein
VLGVLLVVAPTVPAGESMRRRAQGYLFGTATHQWRACRWLRPDAREACQEIGALLRIPYLHLIEGIYACWAVTEAQDINEVFTSFTPQRS